MKRKISHNLNQKQLQTRINIFVFIYSVFSLHVPPPGVYVYVCKDNNYSCIKTASKLTLHYLYPQIEGKSF